MLGRFGPWQCLTALCVTHKAKGNGEVDGGRVVAQRQQESEQGEKEEEEEVTVAAVHSADYAGVIAHAQGECSLKVRVVWLISFCLYQFN